MGSNNRNSCAMSVCSNKSIINTEVNEWGGEWVNYWWCAKCWLSLSGKYNSILGDTGRTLSSGREYKVLNSYEVKSKELSIGDRYKENLKNPKESITF